MRRLRSLVVFLLAAVSVQAQSDWRSEFARMPLVERASELDRHNCARLLLNSFRRNPAVQALVIMPGATDELYFFRRARAQLTNAAPTLLDAITALTNQTFIQADVVPPFLVLHTVEDPLQPLINVADRNRAERIKRSRIEKHAVYNDCDWNYLEPIIAFDINTRMLPGLHTHASNHFFRYSFAEYDLNGWDALRAMAMASKTGFTVKRKVVEFQLDNRLMPTPPNLKGDFLFEKDQ